MRYCKRIYRQTKVNNLREKDSYSPLEEVWRGENDSKHSATVGQNTPKGTAGLLRTIWDVLRGTKDTNGQYTVGTFSFLLFFLFKIIGGIGIAVSFPAMIADICAIIVLLVGGTINVQQLVYYVVTLFVLTLAFLYSVMIWGAAKEIEKEKDKNYVLAVFSGVVSFAALVLTLFQGVK